MVVIWSQTKVTSQRSPTLGQPLRNGKLDILGLVSYNHLFIRGYPELMKPLTELLRGEGKFLEPLEHDKMLVKIKHIFSSSSILLAPNLHKIFIQSTDLLFLLAICLMCLFINFFASRFRLHISHYVFLYIYIT